VLTSGRRSTAPTRKVTPRQPRPGPARKPAARPAAEAPSAARRRGCSRAVSALLVLLALALAIVAVVLITAPSPTRVVLRNVVYTDVQQAASALRQLVNENTR